MKTKLFGKISFPVLMSLTLILFGAAMSFAQTPRLRANGKIAFTSDRYGNLEIYVMNADGTNQVRLTNNLAADDYPTWSPDGTKIAFVSQRPSGGYAIYRMNGDGTNRVEITPINVEASSSSMSWSPDGQRIVFDDNSDIFVVNVDGGNRQNLTNGPEWDSGPSWSPDGSRILFSRYIYPDASHVYGGTIMHTIRPDGTDLRELPNGQATDGWNDDYAKWSPSGDQVVFMGNVWDFYESIFIANADGTNRRLFDGCTFLEPCDEERLFDRLNRINPSWSPDGNWIIYHIANRFHTKVDIFVKNIDGTGFRQLTNTSGRNFNASWQPLLAPSVIDETQFFVRQHYLDFLNREPDAPGQAHWVGEIKACDDQSQRQPGESLALCAERKRANTSAAFFLSPEFQNTGSFVLRVYWGTLGKLPNSQCAGLPAGLSGQCRPQYANYVADMNQVAKGIVVNNQLDPEVINANKRAFVDGFVNKPEFKAIYDSLSNQQFVDKLFATTGIVPTDAERSTLVNGLNTGAETRSSVVFKVVDGTQTLTDGVLFFNTRYGKAFYDREFDAAFVFMEYVGYLQRNPDQAGYEHWLGKLKLYGNWQDAQMVMAFILSPEYRQRFGQ